MKPTEIEVAVIGAGPAGCAAAITLARNGIKTVLIERGDFAGSKNMFGGAIYVKPTKEIYPNFLENAPIERLNVEHNFAFLGEKDSTTFSYKNIKENEEINSVTVIRAKWDRWCVDEAVKAGVYFIPKTLVTDLIKEDGKIVGIKTENEEFKVKITIIADGVNSILARKAGLRKDLKTKDVAIAVKEVLDIKKEILEERFHLDDKTGTVYTIFGGPMLSQLGLGFLYTNQNSVSIGLGITLSEVEKSKKKPYEYLQELKAHPSIAPLIKGGVLKEYSAHLIPEGGFNSLPELYTDGAMIVGDAAMLVNNLHWEGTNLAMLSGKFAAETAIKAIKKNDFSKKSLSEYQKLLEESFILKDLKTYKDLMPLMEKNSQAFLGFYPQKINEFFEMFTSVDSIPKKQKYRDFIKKTIKERNFANLGIDGIKLITLAGRIIF